MSVPLYVATVDEIELFKDTVELFGVDAQSSFFWDSGARVHCNFDT